MNHHPIHTQRYLSPCGPLLLASHDGQLCLCDWELNPKLARHKATLVRTLQAPFEPTPSSTTQAASELLDDYFARRLTALSMPLLLLGTPFQRQVWDALRQIPYGQTLTYSQLATRVGHPRSARPVGTAVGNNFLCLFLPCHRVVGATPSAGGFAGGMDAKRYLLALESTL